MYCISFYELSIHIFSAVFSTNTIGELEQKPSISDGTPGARSTIAREVLETRFALRTQKRPLKPVAMWAGVGWAPLTRCDTFLGFFARDSTYSRDDDWNLLEHILTAYSLQVFFIHI